MIYIHSQDPFDPKNYLKVTFTASGTLVGTGNAAYIYAPVTVEKVGTLPADEKLQLIRTIQPTQLDLKIPAEAIVNPIWMDPDGSNATGDDPPWLKTDGANATGNDTVTQDSVMPVRASGDDKKYEDKTVAHMGDHIKPRTTAPIKVACTFETHSPDVTGGNNKVAIQNPLSSGVMQLRWSMPDPLPLVGGGNISRADLETRFNIHHRLQFVFGDNIITGIVTNFFYLALSQSYFVTLGTLEDPATQTGTFADGASGYLLAASDLVQRDELPDQAFSAETPNIAGAGGSTGRLWGWVSDATDAAWRRLLDVPKADAGTAVKKADYHAALSTGSLDKDAAGSGGLALTENEIGHDLVRFTGALTGDRILSVPANKVTGLLVFRNDTTGAHALKLKVSTQADGAAITLPAGDSLVIHHGGSVSRYGS